MARIFRRGRKRFFIEPLRRERLAEALQGKVEGFSRAILHPVRVGFAGQLPNEFGLVVVMAHFSSVDFSRKSKSNAI